MDLFTSYGHIKKPKTNHRFFDDFRPGLVPLKRHAQVYDHQKIGDFILAY